MYDPSLLKQIVLKLVGEKLEQVTNNWAHAQAELAKANVLLSHSEERENDYPSFGPNMNIEYFKNSRDAKEITAENLKKERLMLKAVYEYVNEKL